MPLVSSKESPTIPPTIPLVEFTFPVLNEFCITAPIFTAVIPATWSPFPNIIPELLQLSIFISS